MDYGVYKDDENAKYNLYVIVYTVIGYTGTGYAIVSAKNIETALSVLKTEGKYKDIGYVITLTNPIPTAIFPKSQTLTFEGDDNIIIKS